MSSRRIIQSHRGIGRLGPENTLESFERGWRTGTVPEADVRSTKDGVIVAFHDDALERLVSDIPAKLKGLRVSDLTWDQVAKLDVGSLKGPRFAGQRVPRMDAVFAAMRGVPECTLYLDIKEVDLEALCALVRECGVVEQVIAASTHYGCIRRWRQLLPRSQTLLWMGAAEQRLRERMAELRAAEFEDVTQLQVHVDIRDRAAGDPFAPSSEFLRSVAHELRPRGILFQALPKWQTMVEDYHRLMDLGVESFATDDPKVALEAVSTYRGKG